MPNLALKPFASLRASLGSVLDLAGNTAAFVSGLAAARAQELNAREEDTYDPIDKASLMHRGLGCHAVALSLLASAVAARLGSSLIRTPGSEEAERRGEEAVTGADLLLMSALFLFRPDFEKAREGLAGNIAEVLGPRVRGGEADPYTEAIRLLRDYALRDLQTYGEPTIEGAVTASGTPVIIETHPTYRLIRPKGNRSALFVTIPHNGTDLPPEAIFLRALPARVTHSNADLWLHKVWESVPDLGGTLMIARVGRYAADLNRTGNQATGRTVRGRPVKSGGAEIAETIWPRDLFSHSLRLGLFTEREFETRISRWHEPFVRRRLLEIEAIKGERGMVFLISAHNCPSRPAQGHADYSISEFRENGRPLFNPGTTRRPIPIGDRHAGRIAEEDRTLPPAVREMVERYFRQAAVERFSEFFGDLRPGTPAFDRRAFSYDSPYGGAAENWRVMDPSREGRTPGFQLELPRELMFDEVTPAHPGGNLRPLPVIDRLREVIERFVSGVYPEIERQLKASYGIVA